MIGIVIVAHGGLAREFLAAVEHVVGRQPGFATIAIEAEFDRSGKQSEICAAADRVDTGAGVVVATDMFGGSPSNLSLRACRPTDRRIIYGANLPMLIKLAKSRHLPVGEAVRLALDAGRKYIDSMDMSALEPGGGAWSAEVAADDAGGAAAADDGTRHKASGRQRPGTESSRDSAMAMPHWQIRSAQ